MTTPEQILTDFLNTFRATDESDRAKYVVIRAYSNKLRSWASEIIGENLPKDEMDDVERYRSGQDLWGNEYADGINYAIEQVNKRLAEQRQRAGIGEKG